MAQLFRRQAPMTAGGAFGKGLGEGLYNTLSGLADQKMKQFQQKQQIGSVTQALKGLGYSPEKAAQIAPLALYSPKAFQDTVKDQLQKDRLANQEYANKFLGGGMEEGNMQPQGSTPGQGISALQQLGMGQQPGLFPQDIAQQLKDQAAAMGGQEQQQFAPQQQQFEQTQPQQAQVQPQKKGLDLTSEERNQMALAIASGDPKAPNIAYREIIKQRNNQKKIEHAQALAEKKLSDAEQKTIEAKNKPYVEGLQKTDKNRKAIKNAIVKARAALDMSDIHSGPFSSRLNIPSDADQLYDNALSQIVVERLPLERAGTRGSAVLIKKIDEAKGGRKNNVKVNKSILDDIEDIIDEEDLRYKLYDEIVEANKGLEPKNIQNATNKILNYYMKLPPTKPENVGKIERRGSYLFVQGDDDWIYSGKV